MKFEKKPRRVIYIASDDIYRVTYDSIRRETRIPRDPHKHLVSVAASVTYWDAVEKRQHILGCARTIQAAWDAGDRYLLDTDKARRSAELVAKLAQTPPDLNDIESALTDLMNAIAEVRLNNTTMDDFEILPILRQTLEICLAIPEYKTWTPYAKRRRFLYELPRKYRTSVVYTLMSLYYGQGAFPILTTKQHQEFLGIRHAIVTTGDSFSESSAPALTNTAESLEPDNLDNLDNLDDLNDLDKAVTFLDECLRKITAYRFS